MKNIIKNIFVKGGLVAGLAAMLLGANACVEDAKVLPEFPATQKLYFNPTETSKEITIQANYAWNITSSALWCQFEDQLGVKSTVLSGQPGEMKAKIIISDEGLNPGQISDVAIIEMQMEDEIRVFAEVFRSEKGYEFTLVDKDGKAIDQKDWVIEVGCSEFLPFQVKANFEFAVTNKPAWVDFMGENGFTGAAGKVASSSAIFVQDKGDVRYPVEKSDKNVIVFSDKEGKAFFSVPVHFAGMPVDEISFEGPSARQDWEVSMDGKVFTQSGSGLTQGDGKTIFKNKLEYDVTAFKNEFKTVYLEIVPGEWGDMINCSLDKEIPFEPWMHLEGKDGEMNLTVDPAETERKGYVMVFTEAQLDSLGLIDNPASWFDVLIENTMDPETFMPVQEISYAIAQSHLLAELLQKEEKKAGENQGIKVTDNMMNEIPVEKRADVGGEYGTDEIYCFSQSVQSFNIEHFMEGQMGTDWFFQAYNSAGDDVTSMIETLSETMINIWFEENLPAGEKIEILFKDSMTTMNVKVVIIESNQ